VSSEDQDRIAYLAGEPVESLSAEERAELDELRDLLRAPSAWTEPAPDLGDRVVATIAAHAGAPPASARIRRRVFGLFRFSR
jgi:hypothetical protein